MFSFVKSDEDKKRLLSFLKNSYLFVISGEMHSIYIGGVDLTMTERDGEVLLEMNNRHYRRHEVVEGLKRLLLEG